MSIYLNNKKINSYSGIPIINNGTDTTDGTAIASDILAGKIAYSQDIKYVGSLQISADKIVEGEQIAGITGTRRGINFEEIIDNDLPVLIITSNTIVE